MLDVNPGHRLFGCLFAMMRLVMSAARLSPLKMPFGALRHKLDFTFYVGRLFYSGRLLGKGVKSLPEVRNYHLSLFGV